MAPAPPPTQVSHLHLFRNTNICAVKPKCTFFAIFQVYYFFTLSHNDRCSCENILTLGPLILFFITFSFLHTPAYQMEFTELLNNSTYCHYIEHHRDGWGWQEDFYLVVFTNVHSCSDNLPKRWFVFFNYHITVGAWKKYGIELLKKTKNPLLSNPDGMLCVMQNHNVFKFCSSSSNFKGAYLIPSLYLREKKHTYIFVVCV